MKWLGLWLALAAPGAAKEHWIDFTIHTYPSGARVGLYRVDGLQSRPGIPWPEPSYVGLSGQPIHLDAAPFLGEAGDLRMQFQLSMPGHQAVNVTADNDLIQHRRWPQSGAISLPPDHFGVALVDFARAYWRALGLAGLLLATAVGLALRRAGQQRSAQARLDKLERYSTQNVGDDPYLNKRLGPYFVASRLGAGGMAVVYRAVPAETLDESEAVAIKVLAPHLVGDPEFPRRFQREVAAYKQLDHPNIVRLMEWNLESPMFVAMELIEGPTLRDHLGGRRLKVEAAVRLLRPMLEAIAYAHSRNFVHRDLKPENIMLHQGTLVKIMDFGLARGQQVSVKLTASGIALGTPEYMAPEQILGETDPRADQYALGVIAYEMLSGRRPYDGEPGAVLMRHMTEDATPLLGLRPELPPQLAAVVMRMLARDKEARFATVLEVLEELDRLYPEGAG